LSRSRIITRRSFQGWLGSVAVIVSSLGVGAAQTVRAPSPDFADSGKCASCHSQIIASYAKTAMAHASGLATEDPITGSFVHQQSGISYRVYQASGKLWLEFNRSTDPKLQGRKELLYYIGSGRLKGRTYLFNQDGFLFESPINWYAQQRVWDMTPNYHAVREAPLNLPAFPECLNCHTSGMNPPVAGTSNRYPDPPFVHGGVTCERCHGSAVNHIARGEKMLEISTLSPDRRDAICMQCHLEGDVAVERPHKHAYEFRPGDDLSDFARYFVLANKQGTRAVSQFEALAQSACKRASGDKMTCTTCHDPHSTPEPSQKVSYFRSKCLTCHGEAFAQKHHPENPDCVACHMPALSARDISHTQATDHRILRDPFTAAPQSATPEASKLEPFPASVNTKSDVRDLALAYESFAERGDIAAAKQADQLLQSTNKQNPNDAPVLTALGYNAQRNGDPTAARQYYEAALSNDRYADEAATNLGVLEAREGHLQRSVSLWQSVFENAPWRSSVGIDIALGYCAAEKYDRAKFYVNRVLQFNPDFGIARSLLVQLTSDSPSCSLKAR
jgi:predicted CXXCH cytochrome family protein